MSCALCSAADVSRVDIVPFEEGLDLCAICAEAALEGPSDAPHWACLQTAIWAEEPAVKVLAYRMTQALSGAAWAADLLEMAYLTQDEQTAAARVQLPLRATGDTALHRDSNGAVLSQGDSVVLIKDLPVKGGGFTAKRGTAVRSISLVADTPEHIEGRVEGQRIVILTKFVKRSS
jgi:protein PhnA